MSWSPKVKRGQDHPNASTDDETAREIRKDRSQGLTYDELAEKHCVSRSTVRRILNHGAYSS